VLSVDYAVHTRQRNRHNTQDPVSRARTLQRAERLRRLRRRHLWRHFILILVMLAKSLQFGYNRGRDAQHKRWERQFLHR
jgi:hypothetical protein